MASYDEYYLNQAGGKLPVFQGTKFQRGHGFFGRLFKFFLPIVKSALPVVGKHALSTGLSIGKDLIEGEKFSNTARKRLKETGANILDEISQKFNKQSGSGKKRKKRKRKMPFFRKPLITKKKILKKKNKRKRKRKNSNKKNLKSIKRKFLGVLKKKKRKRKNSFPEFLK